MSEYKILKSQWDKLNDFYQKIQPPAQSELYASGDHYLLYKMLTEMGFRLEGDAIDIYEKAGEILAAGWEK